MIFLSVVDDIEERTALIRAALATGYGSMSDIAGWVEDLEVMVETLQALDVPPAGEFPITTPPEDLT